MCIRDSIAVALERLSRKFGVNVSTEEVRIPYRETIAKTTEAEGKLKKQSGGHGQFAVCQLRVSPTGRGEGTSFVDRIVGGSIPRNYIPAVEKGIFEACLLYTSPSPRDRTRSRMPSSA